jgi:single-strand DNA-binding protein
MTNTITVVGNTTRDPELRFTPAGQAVARFGVAVNRRWQGKDGQWQENVSFFDVVSWREMAENVSESLVKGMRVIVSGRLEQRSYETKEGDKRNVFEIVADEVGPSLKWASAEIQKSDRRSMPQGGGSNSQSSGSGDFAKDTSRSEPTNSESKDISTQEFSEDPF